MDKTELEFLLITIVILLLLFLMVQGYYYLRRKNSNLLSENEIDEISSDIILSISNDISNRGPLKGYTYIYTKEDIPLGRASAFLSFFGRNIYDEEPYLFLCERSNDYDKFREYGVIFARTGIYISKELSLKENGHKVVKDVDKYIPLEGIIYAITYGTGVLTLGFAKKSKLLKIKYYNCFDYNNSLLAARYINFLSKKDVGISLMDCNSIENIEKQFKKEEKQLDVDRLNINTEVASIPSNNSRFEAMYGEVKHHMDGVHGAGYGAEYGNNTVDRLLGKDVESAAQNLDEHGKQVKNGADRLVDNVEIQTKYYKTAEETVGAVFEHKSAKYIRSDGTEKMMQIEVPRDQYDKAVKLMQKRIDDGQVPNVEKGEDAHDYVRKGYFTYQQSFNIARAGNIESLSVDLASGAVCSFESAGISAVIVFAQSVWKGVSPEDAIKMALKSGIKVSGRSALIYAFTMQLTRKEIANKFTGKAFTADGIPQGFKAINNPAYNVSETLASGIKNSKLANTEIGKTLSLDQVTGRQLVGTSITAVVTFGPDTIRMIEGKISYAQFAKNAFESGISIAASAVVQTAIPNPAAATIAGTIAGNLSKKVLDKFIEDDAKKMFRIFKEEFIDQMMLTNLSDDEIEKMIFFTFNDKKFAKKLQYMNKAKDHRKYAREDILEPLILGILREREFIDKDKYDVALLNVADITNDVVEC